LYLIFLATGCFSQTYEGRRIVAIAYQPSQVLDPADLERVQTLKVGSPLRTEDVSEGIDRLFATGEFEDIRADAEASGDGVKITFVTTPARYLASVTVRGRQSDPPNRGELAKVPQLIIGNPFKEADLEGAVASMQQLFVANGLYEASIQPDTQVDETGRQVFLRFRVRPRKRAKYDMPEIHGDTKLATGTIVRVTGWRVRFVHIWRKVTEARTRDGIQGILKKYQDSDRLKVKVELEDLSYDAKRRRVTPKLSIDAGPKVEVVATEAKVSDRVLRRYVPVFQERAVDNDLLAEGARNLRDYFQSKGYFDTVVDYRTVAPQPDLERIEFAISQGRRYKLVHVGISGNRYFDQNTLRERMFLEPASLFLRRGRYSEAFRKKDEENISELYRSNGFRDVKVSSVAIPRYQGKAGQIGVTLRIEEGQQWLVDTVEVRGVDEADRPVIEGHLASSAGQPFAEVNVAADRNYMLNYYSYRGYSSADVQGGFQIVAPLRVKVVYTVRPGMQQFVRDVLITGLSQTKMRLVEKRIVVHEGQPLSAIAQRNSQKFLYDMGIFARVDTAIENPEGGTSRKTVLYAIEEANRYTVSLGLGAQVGRFGKPSNSDLSSAAGSTGFSPLLSLNVSRLNFLGIGHTVSARGVYSSLQKRASISYFAPRFQNIDGRSLTVSLLYDQTRDVRTFSSRRQEASIQASQRFSRSTTGLFRLAYRRVAVEDVIIPVLLVPQLLQTVRIGIVSANLARDRRDNSTDARRGSYNTADVALATKFLGSQRSFARVLVRNATYHKITKDLVFARQTQFGLISPFSAPAGLTAQASVPLPERFFGGGSDSLRALPFNQAGPRDTGVAIIPGGPSSQATGFPLGGNALVFNNAEIRFPLIGQNIQGVLFHDIGNIYSTIKDISFRLTQRDISDFNYAVHAAGFGIRYRTPIGPVRVDLAYTFNPPRYLGFGGTATDLLQCGAGSAAPACQSTPQRVSHFQFFFSIGQTF
jgi:outer membrane protein assembly complex protein YaeT